MLSPPAVWMDICWGLSSTSRSPFTCCCPGTTTNHHEPIQFHILHFPHLLLTMVARHNPHIDWVMGAILGWGPSCHQVCLRHAVVLQRSLDSSAPPDHTGVLAEYRDFAEEFNKTKAMSFPPNQTTVPETSCPAPPFHWAIICTLCRFPKGRPCRITTTHWRRASSRGSSLWRKRIIYRLL